MQHETAIMSYKMSFFFIFFLSYISISFQGDTFFPVNVFTSNKLLTHIIAMPGFEGIAARSHFFLSIGLGRT